MELYQLKQLVTIAKAGTISKAAEELLISQPGLTRSIQKLEEELGLSLFDRKKNKVTLNDNGEMAVKYATRILEEATTMVEQLQAYDRSKRIISIGSCAPAPIWGLVHIFKQRYPEMQLEHTLINDNEKLIEGLKKQDYSIIVLPHAYEDPHYISTELFEEHLYLSVPPAHPLSMFKEISFHDLDGESILLLSRIGFWNEICIKMIPNSHLLVQQDNMIYNEILRASALPNFKSNITLLKEKNQATRIAVPISDKEARLTYYAVYKKENKALFSNLKEDFKTIDWKAVEEVT